MWTALGLASIDLAPAESTVVLGPWREAMATPASAAQRIRYRALASLTIAAHHAVTVVVVLIVWLALVSLVAYGLPAR